MKPKFFKSWTEIDESDRRLNQIVIRFNNWMRHSLASEEFDIQEARHINALIEEGLQTWAEETAARGRLEEIRAELVVRCPSCSFFDE